MTQPTNSELCAAFRALLTTGFYADAAVPPDEALRITKPWRGDIWKAFREIEDRLCPVQAMEREKKNGAAD